MPMNSSSSSLRRRKSVGLLSLFLLTGCAHSVYKRPAYQLPPVDLPDFRSVSYRPAVFADIRGYQRTPENTDDDDPIDPEITTEAKQALNNINQQHGLFERITTDPFYREANDLTLKIRLFKPNDEYDGELLEWMGSMYSGGLIPNDIRSLTLVQLTLKDGEGNALGSSVKAADAITYTTALGPLAGVHRDEDATQGFSINEHVMRYALKQLIDQKQLNYSDKEAQGDS